MSRIEEALRRARGETNVQAVDTVPTDAPLDQFVRADEELDAPIEEEIPVEPTPIQRPEPSDLFSNEPATRLERVTTDLAHKLVGATQNGFEWVEQYRRLAAALHHAQVDNGIKVVMVASAVAGEGKTLTAVNLALTLSRSYRRRVLLIDADMRRPMIHQVFGFPNITGLTEGLKAETDRRLQLIEISSHLAVLPGGRPDPDPMGSLTSDRMRRLIREASERFDWVILDTPPVGLLPDGKLLAAIADVVLLVVRAGSTQFDPIQRAVAALGRDRILGVVLNRAANSPSRYHYYHYAYERREADRRTEVAATNQQ